MSMQALMEILLDERAERKKKEEGIHPSKARWMEIGKVRELYPHLLAE